MEINMFDREQTLSPETARLLLAGEAKALTNAGGGSKVEEDIPFHPYDPV
ncbi:MAG: hypothetical protein JWM33_3530 [Caulobacteraceae bacterium]|nr:hypothetical protein [Caulobacteraceae bacterium]